MLDVVFPPNIFNVYYIGYFPYSSGLNYTGFDPHKDSAVLVIRWPSVEKKSGAVNWD
jgi:hypothetical protein